MSYTGLAWETWLQRLGSIFRLTCDARLDLGHQALSPRKIVRRADRLESLDVEPHEIVLLAGARLGMAEDWMLRQEINTARIPNLSKITTRAYDSKVISHLIVDVDHFGGIVFVLGELRRIRDTFPEIVIVLVSGDFSYDDFNCERLAICDVSLRSPVSLASLEFGLSEATNINNPIWQERLLKINQASDTSAA